MESTWKIKRHLREIDNIVDKLNIARLEDIEMIEEANDDLDELVQALGLEDDDVVMEVGDLDEEDEWVLQWVKDHESLSKWRKESMEFDECCGGDKMETEEDLEEHDFMEWCVAELKDMLVDD